MNIKNVKIMMVLVLTFLTGCSSSSEMVFGLGEDQEWITEETDTFDLNDDIYIGVQFDGEFNSSTMKFIMAERTSGGGEQYYTEWEEPFTPSWEGFYNLFHSNEHYEPFETGTYIVRIFDGRDELRAEGEFTIR